MNLLILKSNISNSKKIEKVKLLFKQNSLIHNWSVDTEDVDNVLKVSSLQPICLEEVNSWLNVTGLKCEILK